MLYSHIRYSAHNCNFSGDDYYGNIPHMTASLFEQYETIYDKASIIPQQNDAAEIASFSELSLSRGIPLKIMDIGCAEGKLSTALAKHGHKVTAADISSSFLKAAESNAGREGIKIKTLHCDIEGDISYISERFDMIYFMDILEHLRSPVFGLQNIRKLLKDNGELIINTPNIMTPAMFFSYLKNAGKLIDYYDLKNLNDLHLQTYDYRSLEKLLNFVGFKVYKFVPNFVPVPFLSRFSMFMPFLRFLSRRFLFFSQMLTVRCRKTEPLDSDKLIKFWKERYVQQYS